MPGSQSITSNFIHLPTLSTFFHHHYHHASRLVQSPGQGTKKGTMKVSQLSGCPLHGVYYHAEKTNIPQFISETTCIIHIIHGHVVLDISWWICCLWYQGLEQKVTKVIPIQSAKCWCYQNQFNQLSETAVEFSLFIFNVDFLHVRMCPLLTWSWPPEKMFGHSVLSEIVCTPENKILSKSGEYQRENIEEKCKEKSENT